MVSVYMEVDTAVFEGTQEYLDNLADMVRDVSETVYRRHAPNIIALLSVSVARPSYPINWKSARQRRFVMAMLTRQSKADGTYPDIRYKPAGKLVNGWVSDIRHEDDGVRLEIGNEADFAEFAYGTLNMQSLKRAADSQQPFHADRYQLAAETIRDSYNEIEEDINKELEKADDAAFKLIAKRRSRRPRRRRG